MKSKARPKATRKKSIKKSVCKTRAIQIIEADRLIWRRMKLIEHSHSWKVVHNRHTSHALLFLILLISGFFIFTNNFVAEAIEVVKSGNVTIGMTVRDPAPKVGATILSPVDGATIVDKLVIDVSGVCAKNLFVAVKNNEMPAGSTVCTSTGTFLLQIQLQLGKNTISAKNYDNYNRPGPSTPEVTITAKESDKPAVIEPIEVPPMPSEEKRDNPSIVTTMASAETCEDFRAGELPEADEPHASIVCMPRLFLPGIQQSLGYLTWGGTPPYSLDVDLGDGNGVSRIMIPTKGYNTKKFSYVSAGVFKINLKLRDAVGLSAIAHAAVQVSGGLDEYLQPVDGSANSSSNNASEQNYINQGGDAAKSGVDALLSGFVPWFQTPVPFYGVALAITIGFWGGDLFFRLYGAKKMPNKKRNSA